jgi:hypothetical protein
MTVHPDTADLNDRTSLSYRPSQEVVNRSSLGGRISNDGRHCFKIQREP